jgi:proline iminopeptidase
MKTKLLLLLFLLMLFGFSGSSMNGQESFKTSDGETLYYTRSGHGPRVIILMGGPGFGVNVLQAWADTLDNQYECILFEQRGTGLSSNVRLDSSTINLKRACMDLDELREHLGNEALTLCGISWGGGLAQAYASYYPQHTKRIILISTIGTDNSMNQVIGDNINMRLYPAERDSLMLWNSQPHNPNA